MENISFLTNAAEPWVVYRTLIDLLERDEDDPQVRKAREEMIAHPLVNGLVEELKAWPGDVISSHKSAGQHYHKLSFLADLGLTAGDDNLREIGHRILSHRSKEGLFQLGTNIPTHFGGTGEETWAWALCDAPLVMYSVVKMGLSAEDEYRGGVDYLLGLVRDNGWPCAVSEELGKFRGPGRKGDPCPYVNLIMLKLFTLFEEHQDSKETRIGVECLLNLWEKSKEEHPYMFFMGTDFRKLKAPFIWYDILHVAEVLSHYDFALRDGRFIGMVDLINAKADEEGLFTPESEWKAWKGWDFGQKKKPSSWLTFLVYRINRRVGAIQE